MSSVALLIIFLSIVPQGQCWGIIGHSLIARLAETQLDKNVHKWMTTHLTNDMSEIAFWADNIHNSADNIFSSNNWQWTKPLHYINIPTWSCHYVYERDCIDNICTHGALKNYSTRLMTFENAVLHQQDFFFLVHFVGDIHQPLHAGFKDDRGGNAVTGRFMNSSTNLHSLWDTNIIKYRIDNEFQRNTTSYFNYLYQKMLNHNPGIDDEHFLQWIVESIDIVCKHVYLDETNATINTSTRFDLSRIYYERNWPIIEKRLIQAGFRLGTLLNRVLKIHAESATTIVTGSTNTAVTTRPITTTASTNITGTTPPITTITTTTTKQPIQSTTTSKPASTTRPTATNMSCQHATFSSPFLVLVLLLILKITIYFPKGNI